MTELGWKKFERRIARLVGGKRIPVTGDREGEDVEAPLFLYQCKKRKTVPEYLVEWLDGIHARAKQKEKIGVVVMKRPHRRDLDAIVCLTLRDWIDLNGGMGPSCEVCGCTEVWACDGGCGWDPKFLAQGRYVCTNCSERAS